MNKKSFLIIILIFLFSCLFSCNSQTMIYGKYEIDINEMVEFIENLKTEVPNHLNVECGYPSEYPTINKKGVRLNLKNYFNYIHESCYITYLHYGDEHKKYDICYRSLENIHIRLDMPPNDNILYVEISFPILEDNYYNVKNVYNLTLTKIHPPKGYNIIYDGDNKEINYYCYFYEFLINTKKIDELDELVFEHFRVKIYYCSFEDIETGDFNGRIDDPEKNLPKFAENVTKLYVDCLNQYMKKD